MQLEDELAASFFNCWAHHDAVVLIVLYWNLPFVQFIQFHKIIKIIQSFMVVVTD